MKPRISIFTIFNDPVSPDLDSILNYILKQHKLKDVIYENAYWFVLCFGDKIKIRAWNTSKWFAWFCRGEIEMSDNCILRWDDSRPSRRTMNKILNAIDEYHKEKISTL